MVYERLITRIPKQLIVAEERRLGAEAFRAPQDFRGPAGQPGIAPVARRDYGATLQADMIVGAA
jgi:hypothetical protein